MRTHEDKNSCTCKVKTTVSNDAIQAYHLSPIQIELLNQIALRDTRELAESLRYIHDLALYHSDVSINAQEKESLYDVIELSKLLGQLKAS